MATITPPNYAAPITAANQGANHQACKPAVPNYTPSHYNPVPVAANLAGGVTGTAYLETISAQGGSTPYAFAVTSGSLPTSTSLNSSSGVISGTPTVTGTYSFTITVTDTNGFTGSQAFQIVIASPSAGGSSFGFVA